MGLSAVEPGQQREDDAGFLFVGENLAIDLVNTEIVARGKPIDLLAPPGAYGRWWRAAAARYPALADELASSEANPELESSVMALRGALRTVFDAVAADAPVPPQGLATLNRTLAASHDAVALDTGGVLQPLLLPSGPETDGPQACVARAAFTLLTRADRSRLHRCANGRCVLLFYDTTKSATRRWCSTACMNRARSAERYRQQKQGKLVRGGAPARGKD
jgi:predicted RNA-binding Zn ribbon-like protein